MVYFVDSAGGSVAEAKAVGLAFALALALEGMYSRVAVAVGNCAPSGIWLVHRASPSPSQYLSGR